MRNETCVFGEGGGQLDRRRVMGEVLNLRAIAIARIKRANRGGGGSEGKYNL